MLIIERKRKKLTRKELAAISGVSVSSIQYWEDNGISRATVGNALKVAKALGCTLDDLARGDYR